MAGKREGPVLDRPVVYQVRVQGELDRDWSSWFEDGPRISAVSITTQHGVSTVTGTVADQPALYGLLGRVRDLGLLLLSVSRLDLTDAPARTCGD